MSDRLAQVTGEAFKESANNDIEIIEILLSNGNNNILIFYHLQQALEKILKAVIVEINSDHLNCEEVKNKYNHYPEKILFKLIKDLANFYIKNFKKMEDNNSELSSKAIEQINSFLKTVNKEFDAFKKKWENSYQNFNDYYNNFVDKVYDTIIKYKK